MDIRYVLNGREVTREEFCAHHRERQLLKEMLEAQVPPLANTDREFMEGHCNGSQFDGKEYLGDFYRKRAEAMGQNVKGKVYMSSLAAFPGDPRAWVSGKGDVENLLDERGWGSEGIVNRKLQRLEETPTVPVNEAIVQREVGEVLQTLPAEERPHVDTEDLADQIRQKRQKPRALKK